MIEFTQSEILAYFTARVPRLKASRGHWRCPCPVHDGKDDNFSVDPETGQCYCHSQCGRGWDVISLEMELSGADFITSKAAVFKVAGRPEPSWEDRDVEATFDYRDADGKLLYQVVRKSGKKFMQRRPDGQGGWQWGLGEVRPVPYRLPDIAKQPFVAIAEGERDSNTLARLGIPATTNNGGAGNFKPELAVYFAGKSVAIFADNDDPGRKHALKVAEILSPVAKSVRIVELPNLPAKGDVTDFVQRGGTVDQIRECYRRAQEWTPEWVFSADVPDENDKYVRTLAQVITEAGGADRFWDFRLTPGIPTPWRKATEALNGGMRRGEVYVIGGNQGSGKTSLGLQFIITALNNGKRVLMFSMEMGHRDVFQRICSIEARVDLRQYAELQREAPESAPYNAMCADLAKAQRYLMDKPLVVSRKPSVTPEYLLEESTRLSRDVPWDLICVDHMQLMSTTGNVRSDYEKFTAISRASKQTAVEVNAPLILLSQTSRSNSHEKRTELDVSDLRGSGAIEEDACAVFLIYPDKDDRERQLTAGTYSFGPVKSWMKLGKNRYGLQDMYLPLWHYKTCTRFDLWAQEIARTA